MTESAARSRPLRLSAMTGLFLQECVALFGQSIEFFALLRDTIGIAFLGLATGGTCCLFHQLPEIVFKYRDAVVEFGPR
jgi:hypothetical protein